MSKGLVIGGAAAAAGYLLWKKKQQTKPYGQNPEDWAKKWTEGQSTDIISPKKMGPIIGTADNTVDVAGDVQDSERDWFLDDMYNNPKVGLSHSYSGYASFVHDKELPAGYEYSPARWDAAYRQLHLPASRLKLNQLTRYDFELAAQLVSGELPPAEGGYSIRTRAAERAYWVDEARRFVGTITSITGALFKAILEALGKTGGTQAISGPVNGILVASQEAAHQSSDAEVAAKHGVTPEAIGFMRRLMRNPHINLRRPMNSMRAIGLGSSITGEDIDPWTDEGWERYKTAIGATLKQVGWDPAVPTMMSYGNIWAPRYQFLERGPIFNWNSTVIHYDFEKKRTRTLREVVNIRARIYRAIDFCCCQVFPYSIPRMLDSPAGKTQWGYDAPMACYNWMANGMVETRGSVFKATDTDTQTRFRAPPWRASEVLTVPVPVLTGSTQVLTTTTPGTQVLTTGQGGTTGNTGRLTLGGYLATETIT